MLGVGFCLFIAIRFSVETDRCQLIANSSKQAAPEPNKRNTVCAFRVYACVNAHDLREARTWTR